MDTRSIINDIIENRMGEAKQKTEDLLYLKSKEIVEGYKIGTSAFIYGIIDEKKRAEVTDKEDDGEGMDPVGAEDGDVDNDGDSDESDDYLRNRRKKIKKAIDTREDVDDLEFDEEVQQLDELLPLIPVLGAAAKMAGGALLRKGISKAGVGLAKRAAGGVLRKSLKPALKSSMSSVKSFAARTAKDAMSPTGMASNAISYMAGRRSGKSMADKQKETSGAYESVEMDGIGLDEVSLKTKIGAYTKMKQTAREKEGDPYTDRMPSDRKAEKSREDRMLKNIEKKHGSKAAKHAERSAAFDEPDEREDTRREKRVNRQRPGEIDSRKPTKAMKGGPRKGKIRQDDADARKLSIKRNLKKEDVEMDEGMTVAGVDREKYDRMSDQEKRQARITYRAKKGIKK